MVIDVTSPEEVTCRFGDGRLEDRYVFELDPAPNTWVDSFFFFLRSPFSQAETRKRTSPPGAATRPRIARPGGPPA